MTIADLLDTDGKPSQDHVEIIQAPFKSFNMRLLIIFLAFAIAPVVFTYIPLYVFVSHEKAIQSLQTQAFLAIELIYCVFMASIVMAMQNRNDN